MNLSPVKSLLVSLVLVARPRNEVVTGQLPHRAAAQATRSALGAIAHLAHVPILAPFPPAWVSETSLCAGQRDSWLTLVPIGSVTPTPAPYSLTPSALP